MRPRPVGGRRRWPRRSGRPPPVAGRMSTGGGAPRPCGPATSPRRGRAIARPRRRDGPLVPARLSYDVPTMTDTILIVDDEEPVRRTFAEWLAAGCPDA